MRKKPIVIIGCIVAFIILITVVAPYIILAVDMQEEPAENYAYSEVFFDEYEDVRQHLFEAAEKLTTQGNKLEFYSHPIDEEENLYIDTMYIAGTKESKNLIVLTTGVHGIEGYIGSVMLDVFWKELYPELDKENTGVLVLANVNPYGMKYHRRYNENNVDLNRNFIMDWGEFDLTVNKDYPKVHKFLGPKTTMGNIFWHEAGFYGSMITTLLGNGVDAITNALLGGQYEYPEGVYYGGVQDQESTIFVKDAFEKTLTSEYENIVHIDIHSGYGARYRMVIFNSAFDTMTEQETKELFQYDNVIAIDSEDFYPTTGDTTDYYYRLWEKLTKEEENRAKLAGEEPETKTLFSTCFEFGTIGDGFWDSVISMKYTIEENQNHWHPTGNKVTDQVIKERYQELFYPTETKWRAKTVADFAEACRGVFAAKLLDGTEGNE